MPLVVYRHKHCHSIWVTPSHSRALFVLRGKWGRETGKERELKIRREGAPVLVEIEMTLAVIHEIPANVWQEHRANV